MLAGLIYAAAAIVALVIRMMPSYICWETGPPLPFNQCPRFRIIFELWRKASTASSVEGVRVVAMTPKTLWVPSISTCRFLGSCEWCKRRVTNQPRPRDPWKRPASRVSSHLTAPGVRFSRMIAFASSQRSRTARVAKWQNPYLPYQALE